MDTAAMPNAIPTVTTGRTQAMRTSRHRMRPVSRLATAEGRSRMIGQRPRSLLALLAGAHETEHKAGKRGNDRRPQQPPVVAPHAAVILDDAAAHQVAHAEIGAQLVCPPDGDISVLDDAADIAS